MTDNRFNRRNFVKSAFLGSSGALLARKGLAGEVQAIKSERKIIKRTLGKTGIEIPVLSMGVMRADNPNLLRAAYKEGIRHFDTAHSYQGGRNEEMCGEVFREFDRDSLIVTTKVKPKEVNSEGELGPGSTKEAFLEMFETSLKRLQIDYVDMLMQHVVSTRQAVLYEPILDALLTAKKQGKTRFIGVSTHRNEPEVILAAIDSGVIDVVLTSINFRQDHQKELAAAIAKAAEKGIGIIGMKNLAGGYMDKERTMPVNAKAAIKWVLQNPDVTTCIPGFIAFNELQEDVDILSDISLTGQELQDLALLNQEMGMYCQGCGNCIAACSKGLPIPEIMRAYMYTYGYRQLDKARYVLEEYGVNAHPCEGCEQCTAACPQGFPVREKIEDVSRILDVPIDFIT